MLKNLTVKQHLDNAEKQWQIIADTGIDKQQALEQMGISDAPVNECFLCEVFQHDSYNTILKVTKQECHCKQCPLSPIHLYCGCERHDQPYSDYEDLFCSQDMRKKSAKKIVELIKKGKKKLNY